MKTKTKILGLLLVLILFSPTVLGVVKDVNCFDYYWYGRDKEGKEVEIFQGLYPEKAVYSAGDSVRLNYKVKNEFGSPLVEGGIFAIVLYRGPEDVDRMQGDDIIDEFWVEKDINLDVGKSYEDYFEWEIPKNAKEGVYVTNLYFMVDEKFNVAGLTFHTEIPGKTTTFEVENSGIEESILFHKNETYVNGEKYLFRAYIPSFSEGTKVNIEAQLLSENVKEAKVTSELYSWADSSEENKIDKFTKEEDVDLREGAKTVQYSLENLPVGVYVAKFTAEAGELKSILRVRFAITGSEGKFNFLGLDHFPLMKGDETGVFFCIYNSAAAPGEVDVNFTGEGTVTLVGPNGKEITKETYGPGEVTPQIQGKKFSFTSPKDLTKVTLKGDLYDSETGELMDSVEIVYDYSQFKNIERVFQLKTLRNNEETNKFPPGDELSYEVIYKDKYGDALSGEVVLYLEDKEEKIKETVEKSINGVLEGKISLSGLEKGSYTLKAVEKKEHLKDSKSIKIKKVMETTLPKVSTTIPVEKKKPQTAQLLLWGLVVIGIILVLIRWGWKRK